MARWKELLGLAAIVCAGRASGVELGYYSQPALNGDRLIFVSEGDLWTATLPPAPGGEPIIAHRLTTGDGAESHPVISTDGRWLAFAGTFDGNRDVYVMPIEGGAPTRLTFHPTQDVPLAWTIEGANILFRSARTQPLGRPELWRIARGGGMPRRFAFGECSMVSLSSTGRRFAFTRWSNEGWVWKGYRGGTAPDIWVGDFTAESFAPLTDGDANDMFPMWVAGRVYYLSDRAGSFNIFSDRPQGGDLKQHTVFAPRDANPTAIEGYDVRWPSADAARRGSRIVFCQAGALALLDVTDDSITRLDVRLASDRIGLRRRFEQSVETFSEIALSSDGQTLLLGSRGELLDAPVDSGTWRQLTRTPAARERGASYLDEETILLITDTSGEQQLAVMAADGSRAPGWITEEREAWLFPPVASPDGRHVAFADHTMRLHAVNLDTLDRWQVDRAEAGEITDYRFSPDGNWLAYVKPLPNAMSAIHIYSLRTRRGFAVSDGRSRDREPRWDPAGKYLYFLSDRHLNPVLGVLDTEHIFIEATQVYALPLAADTPPPLPELARAAGMDLQAWAKPPSEDAHRDVDADAADVLDEGEGFEPPAGPGAGEQEPAAMRVDTDNLPARHWLLPVEPGNHRELEALPGALLYVTAPVEGLLDEVWPKPPIAPGKGVLHRFDLVKQKDKAVGENIDRYVISADRRIIAHASKKGVVVRPVAGPGEAQEVLDPSEAQLRVDVRREWRHLLEEAWRLQRDFFWAPNLVGVDWEAMREKYLALLPRVGTRDELNDVIRAMINELGTSHGYVGGGSVTAHEEAPAVSVGMLGADIAFNGVHYRIERILPGRPWDEHLRSPLAAAHLAVKEGSLILAVNQQPLAAGMNIYDLLQDEAGKMVTLTIADDDRNTNRRDIRVRALAGEGKLRYLDWVEHNRRAVAEASDGRIGYVHIPDMGGEGLSLFARQFYPQYRKPALIIDIRDNGGGFVSQMVLQRLARRLLGFGQPRYGVTSRYPERAPNAHMVVLIDEHAGSDGDIFPAAFRLAGLGPLFGTRTWGGVVGIRADKPFLDLGMSTQPEFAWWDHRGWSIEGVGVVPDREIAITPADRAAGRDRQLELAISHLLEALQTDPKEIPATPEYPVRR